jgi:hypothetical protein
MKKATMTSILSAVLATVALAVPNSWAGCGCDHPAPCPAPVLPAFGSPGDSILLTGSGFGTDGGNKVVFQTGRETLQVDATAYDPEHMKVKVPAGVTKENKLVGPAKIRVMTPSGQTVNFSEDEFTYLGSPLVLEEGQGHYIYKGVTLAVDTSGVLNVPLDISNVTAATAFAVYLEGLDLEFGTDDLLVYNKQGYNLNLFTLDVDGVEKQWGAWYPPQSLGDLNGSGSNVFTYWRHDFIEYNAAHSPGGKFYPVTEANDLTLLHPDGTVHVDHSQLNVAVAGTVNGNPLPGGAVKVTVHVLQIQTDDPDVFLKLTKKEWKELNKAKTKIK